MENSSRAPGTEERTSYPPQTQNEVATASSKKGEPNEGATVQVTEESTVTTTVNAAADTTAVSKSVKETLPPLPDATAKSLTEPPVPSLDVTANSLKETPPPLPDATAVASLKKEEMPQLPDPNVAGETNLAMNLLGPSICPPALPLTRGTVSPEAAAGKKVPKKTKTPKRECRFPGCTRHVKSQGHCQRHGAQAKRCKVAGCTKQAQGTHDGMCKRHWKEVNLPADAPKVTEPPLPEPEGDSVYDSILPLSLGWKPPKRKPVPGEKEPVMPIIAHLRAGVETNQPMGWHRADERAARGAKPVTGNSVQFEPWERQLVMFEAFLINGNAGHSYKDLAHGWGREKGFHTILINQICERRGEMERKKRSDRGRTFTAEQRLNFRTKLNKTRGEKRKRLEVEKNLPVVAALPQPQDLAMTAPPQPQDLAMTAPPLPQDLATTAPPLPQPFNPSGQTQLQNFSSTGVLLKHEINVRVGAVTDNGMIPTGNSNALYNMDAASAAAAAAIDELKEAVLPVEVPRLPNGEPKEDMSQVAHTSINI